MRVVDVLTTITVVVPDDPTWNVRDYLLEVLDELPDDIVAIDVPEQALRPRRATDEEAESMGVTDVEEEDG